MKKTFFAIILFSFFTLWACEVPVFRYALERWPADLYLVKIVEPLEGLDSEQEDLLDGLRRRSAAEGGANYKIIREKSDVNFPSLEVYYPQKKGVKRHVWKGFLTEENVKAVSSSPARDALRKKLLDGISVVWVILESGNKEADEKFIVKMKEYVQKSRKNLKLSDEIIAMDDLEKINSASTRKELDNVIHSAIPLKIDFDFLRVSRTDVREELFTRMLLRHTPGIMNSKEAIAFPVFGRGRVIEGVPSSKVTEKAIDEMCQYLCGACSCTVKADNPGVDIIMNVPWAEHVAEGTMKVREVLPPLLGLSDIAQADSSTSEEAEPVITEIELAPSSVVERVEKKEESAPMSYFLIALGVAGSLVLLMSFLGKKS